MFVKKKLPYGMYFPKCSSIHTFFCFQTLSVYFLEKIKKVKNCTSVLEFSVNTVDEKQVLTQIKRLK